MTSQEADFDADLDFDRFGMTGFCEALTFNVALMISSSFSGWREIGLERSGVCRFVIVDGFGVELFFVH